MTVKSENMSATVRSHSKETGLKPFRVTLKIRMLDEADVIVHGQTGREATVTRKDLVVMTR